MTFQRRRDALITLLGLGLLAAWDMAGLDMPVMRSLGTVHGFVWRNASELGWLHSGGRMAAWVVLGFIGWMGWKEWKGQVAGRATPHLQPARLAHYRYWVGITLLCLLTINVIKQLSATSCPWDLAEFGGVARHISHWALLTADGGPGQCFPSGHSSAAFAFFSLYFLHRHNNAKRANFCLAVVLLAGLIFSLTQIVRGAHYPSHALWTAWLCWTVCWLADRWLMRKRLLQGLAYH